MAQKLKAEQLDFFVGESQSLKEQPQLRIERLRALETQLLCAQGPCAGTARGAIALTEAAGVSVAGAAHPRRGWRSSSARRIHAEAGEDARELLTVTCDDMHTLRTLILNTDAAGLVPRATDERRGGKRHAGAAAGDARHRPQGRLWPGLAGRAFALAGGAGAGCARAPDTARPSGPGRRAPRGQTPCRPRLRRREKKRPDSSACPAFPSLSPRSGRRLRDTTPCRLSHP
ncbi:hypothetical protein ACU4GD_19690 [Cupriavidus basilensis]